MVSFNDIGACLQNCFSGYYHEIKIKDDQVGKRVNLRANFNKGAFKCNFAVFVNVFQSLAAVYTIYFDLINDTYYSKKLIQEFNSSSNFFKAENMDGRLGFSICYQAKDLNNLSSFVSTAIEEMRKLEKNQTALNLVSITSKVV